MTSQFYRIIEHTADTGFEVRGDSRRQVFERVASAFFHIMWKLDSQDKGEPDIIKVNGGDMKEVLVNFLEEFLYLYDARGIVCCGIEVDSVSETDITASVKLKKFAPDKDRELLGVKAVTYHQLEICRKNSGWLARVFLDI